MDGWGHAESNSSYLLGKIEILVPSLHDAIFIMCCTSVPWFLSGSNISQDITNGLTSERTYSNSATHNLFPDISNSSSAGHAKTRKFTQSTSASKKGLLYRLRPTIPKDFLFGTWLNLSRLGQTPRTLGLIVDNGSKDLCLAVRYPWAVEPVNEV